MDVYTLNITNMQYLYAVHTKGLVLKYIQFLYKLTMFVACCT